MLFGGRHRKKGFAVLECLAENLFRINSVMYNLTAIVPVFVGKIKEKNLEFKGNIILPIKNCTILQLTQLKIARST